MPPLNKHQSLLLGENVANPQIKIVLIEDNEDDAYLIESALDNRHQLLHWFKDGEEALQSLENGDYDPDIVLVDFRLPTMDGLEIITKLSQVESPIFSCIMLTSDTRIETAIDAMKAGARDFHPKTWGFDSLPEIIARVYRIHHELKQKRAYEQALHRSERLLKFAIDQIPIPIIVADAESGIIQHINEPALELAQLSPHSNSDAFTIEEIAPRLPCRNSETSHPDIALNPLITAFLEGVAGKDVELFTSIDGADRWVSASAAPLCDENNHRIAVVGAFPDVTAQKEATLQLEEINASKDRFFSIIGHDLRNPVHQIQLALHLLITNFDQLKQEKVNQYLHNIQTGSDNLIRLLESLLQWGRLQTESISIKPEPIYLAEVIEEAIYGFHLTAEKKSITLDYHCSDDLSILGDINMFNTIIRNLLSNAIKFTPVDGRVKITVSNEDKFVSIAVSDTGIGIPPNKIPALFNVSENKIQSGTDGERGTGLGLMFCKDLTKINKGYIEAHSELGKGTTITVYFPRFNPS